MLIAGFISFYYNILIAYSLIFAISSFLPTLPWTECDFLWNDEKCCISVPIEDETDQIMNFRTCSNLTQSPAKQYFENFVLTMSDDIGNFGPVNW